MKILKRIIRFFVVLLAIGVIGVVGGFWTLRHFLFADINRKEAVLKSKATADAAGAALARLCQSDPFYFLDEPPFRPAWTPPEVRKLEPTSVEIATDSARVEFGGGFHHFGYNLALDKTASSKTENAWKLIVYSEDSADQTVATFKLPKSAHVDLDQFINGALAEFKKRASQPSVKQEDVAERTAFLLKFDRPDLAIDTIHRCAQANPNDWADQLLSYALDAKRDPAALSRLNAWAQHMNGFGGWLLAAYACNASGDADAAEHCVKQTLTYPVSEPPWFENNIRFYGATICAQLLKAGRYQTCATLCDRLLAFTDDGNVLTAEISAIRSAAINAKPGKALTLPALPSDMTFNPFKDIDLAWLTSASATTRPTTTLPSSPAERRLDYYDHRIAADPKSTHYYTAKMESLLSLHRMAQMRATCEAAEAAIPDWWRPPMVLAEYAEESQRHEAEARLKKWVAAHPAFIHWWYLSRYEREHGKDREALAALNQAVTYPLEQADDDETWTPAAFAFDAAAYAYRQKQYALVLEITKVWASPQGAYNYFDNDIYAFRAAAELALGQFPQAKADADKVVAISATQGLWAQNLPQLQKAADRQDRNFVYDPGTLPGNWALFSRP